MLPMHVQRGKGGMLKRGKSNLNIIPINIKFEHIARPGGGGEHCKQLLNININTFLLR